MARPRIWPPPIYSHPSGEDRVRLYDADGKPYWVTLGKTGSPQAREKYARILTEYQPGQPRRLTGRTAPITVGELVASYLEHKQTADYRERKHLLRVMTVAVSLYGWLPVKDFGVRQLEQIRSNLVRDGISGRLANRYTTRIKACFKWGYQRELIPLEAYTRLTLLEPLRRRDNDGVTWHDPVEDVPAGVVEATLPFLAPVVADMVRIQRLAGLRPGEVVQLRPGDIDRHSFSVDGVPIWIYSPGRHKKQHRGQPRRVPLGPQAQAILATYLDRPQDEYCFSPREVLEQKGVDWTARKKRPPGNCYRVGSYCHAIVAACKKAGVVSWHPHQLRHSAATLAHAEMDLDHAQAMLGHDSPDMTRHYSHAQLLKAARAAAKLG